MSFRKTIACAILGVVIAFSAGIGAARAEVRPARTSANIVVEDEGLLTTVRATPGGGWEDVVSMYDVPVVILSCHDENQTGCDKAKAVLHDLAESEGGQKWAFVFIANGLENTDLEPMLTVGDNPAWVATFFGDRSVSELLSYVKSQLTNLSDNKAYRHLHCLPPVYTSCH
jgi:hypothetical protein